MGFKARQTYSTVLERFLGATAIAERVHRESKHLSKTGKQQVCAWLDQIRELAHAVPRSAASLRMLERDFLVQWNEGVGPDVELFWALVADSSAGVTRKTDIVVETLARGSVKNMFEYVELDDNFEAIQRCGKIDESDAVRLNAMLDAFASAPENQIYFDSGGDDSQGRQRPASGSDD